MIQFIGLIIAGYCSVKMIEILMDNSKEKFVKIVAAVNLLATILFALMIFASGATIPKF